MVRGYEFWVAKEARSRRGGIRLYALPWEWPAWVGQGTGDPFHNVSKPVRYVMEWIQGAKRVHGLTTDFIGIWNENAYSVEYILALRGALDQAGLERTRIVAPDGNRTARAFFQEATRNATLAAAIHAVGFSLPES